MPTHVAMLLGKPPRPGTIIAEVRTLLEQDGVTSEVLLPHEQEATGEVARAADLVLHRGLTGADLDLVADLDRNGIPLCNPWGGMQNLLDRAALHAAIDAAGLPSPDGRVLPTWEHVLELAATTDLVVKVVHGGGRGSGVLASPLAVEPPGDGPFLVEDLIPHDGVDRKLYVAGDRVCGLLKPSTLAHEHTTEGEPFEVDDGLADLARRAATGLDLHLLGVDVVLGPAGPVIVDINPFPGYRGVDTAAQDVAGHLLDHLR